LDEHASGEPVEVDACPAAEQAAACFVDHVVEDLGIQCIAIPDPITLVRVGQVDGAAVCEIHTAGFDVVAGDGGVLLTEDAQIAGADDGVVLDRVGKASLNRCQCVECASSIADCAVATVSGVVEATARVVVATSRVAVPTAGVVVSSARAVETAGALWIEVSAY